jgi:hypothetical protein
MLAAPLLLLTTLPWSRSSSATLALLAHRYRAKQPERRLLGIGVLPALLRYTMLR